MLLVTSSKSSDIKSLYLFSSSFLISTLIVIPYPLSFCLNVPDPLEQSFTPTGLLDTVVLLRCRGSS